MKKINFKTMLSRMYYYGSSKSYEIIEHKKIDENTIKLFCKEYAPGLDVSDEIKCFTINKNKWAIIKKGKVDHTNSGFSYITKEDIYEQRLYEGNDYVIFVKVSETINSSLYKLLIKNNVIN